MKKLLIAILLSLAANAWSAMVIESFDLHYRTAEEIIPIIKPMLAADASITGSGYKLIIKSTPENLDRVATLLKELDINPKNLTVYVSLGRQTETRQSEQAVQIEANNDVTSVEAGSAAIEGDSNVAITNDRSKFNARIYESRSRNQAPDTQVMTVTEGYWARIAMGQSIPRAVRTRNPDGTVTETVTYEKVMTGFQVMSRTNGDQVTLTIRPIRQSMDSAGNITTTELESTVSGKLGQWLLLGSTDQAENLKNSGITYRTRIRSTDINQIWVKVVRP